MEPAPEEPPLNVDPFAQLRLLDLQALDTRADQLAHRRRSLPEATRHAELEQRSAVLGNEIVAARTLVSDLEREQAKADADVDQVRLRAAKDRDLLDSGTVGSAKQLESLQRELESLARRQSDLEEVELEVMERLDAAQKDLGRLNAEREALDTDIAAVAAARDAAYGDIDAELATVTGERASVAGELPTDLVALYEKLRGAHDGVGAAALYRGRCEGCRIQLTPVDIERIRAAASDEVLRCEECRRILVRTAESGLS
ncbi:MAG: C4-type zinc ribbon domain-containing protein [Candidatus Nanopelagicales bacterium]